MTHDKYFCDESHNVMCTTLNSPQSGDLCRLCSVRPPRDLGERIAVSSQFLPCSDSTEASCGGTAQHTEVAGRKTTDNLLASFITQNYVLASSIAV